MGGDPSHILAVMQKEMADAKTATAYTPPTSEAQDFKGLTLGQVEIHERAVAASRSPLIEAVETDVLLPLMKSSYKYFDDSGKLGAVTQDITGTRVNGAKLGPEFRLRFSGAEDAISHTRQLRAVMIFLEIMSTQTENPAFRELMDADKFGAYVADLLGLDTDRVGMKTREQIQAYREQVAATMQAEREQMMALEMAKINASSGQAPALPQQ